MTETKIAVIVLPGDEPAHLLQCLDSINAQTRKADEVILAGGCKTSAPAGYRLAIIEGDCDSTANLINRSVKSSTADLFLVMPDHDLLAPTFLESASEHLQRFNSELTVVSTRVFEASRLTTTAPTAALQVLAAPNQPVPMLFRRRIFDSLSGFQSAGAPHELADFAIRALTETKHISSVELPLYYFRPQLPFAKTQALIELHKQLYTQHLTEILELKDQQVGKLVAELAPQCERLRTDLEKLQFNHASLASKHNELEEHHARSLASIKVTATHLVKAISAKVIPGR